MVDVVNREGKHRPKRRHHGAGTIIERTDCHRNRTQFAGVLSAGYQGRRRLRLWFYGASREAVQAEMDRAIDDLNAGVTVDALTTTVGEYAASWLESHRDAIRPSSWDSYRTHLKLRIVPSLGDIILARLTVEQVDRAVRSWTAGPGTRKLALAVLSAALDQAVTRGILVRNVARLVEPPRVPEPEPRPIIGPDEARRIISAMAEHRLAPLVITTFGLGLRRGEALGMRWQDMNGGMVRIGMSLRRIPKEYRLPDEGPYRLVEPKSPKSRRPIPIPPFVAAALDLQRSRQDAERKAARTWAPNNLVFTDPHGNALPPNSVTRAVELILRRAGFEGIKLHDLRHAFATVLTLEGVSPRVLMDLMGHTRADQTAHYAHVAPAAARQAADRLDKALGKLG